MTSNRKLDKKMVSKSEDQSPNFFIKERNRFAILGVLRLRDKQEEESASESSICFKDEALRKIEPLFARFHEENPSPKL